MPRNAGNTIFTTISGHFNTGFRTLDRYLSRSARLQLIDQLNRIFCSAILILQSFIQLKYRGINDHAQSLFAAHPTPMLVAVASSALYLLAYGAVLRFPCHRFASLAHHVLVSSGCTAVASLASVTLFDTARPLVYAVLGSLAAAAAGLLYFLYLKLVEEEDETGLLPFLQRIFSPTLPI
ncbi:hypothetical protein SASPL_114378 [Salvia splendens]|uniref:Uncharacterized protein n=1 Tax=Salvia splendens TaxID=180675 RepID=A0A8X8Y3N0_SALSN|nr:hypothetical protein SASPL_114378 [Salvia splendens]